MVQPAGQPNARERLVRLEVLGPLRIIGIADARPISPRARNAPLAFAALALAERCSHQALVDAVWPGESVRNPDGTIDSRVQQKLHPLLDSLRQHLGRERGRLRSDAGTITLRRGLVLGSSFTTDVDDFTRLRRALDTTLMWEALALFRGRFLEGSPVDEWQEQWIVGQRRQFESQVRRILKLLVPDETDLDERTADVMRGDARLIQAAADAQARAPTRHNTGPALAWLAERTSRPLEECEREFTRLLRQSESGTVGARSGLRRELAIWLRDYYRRAPDSALRFCDVVLPNDDVLGLSVLTRPSWLNLAIDLRYHEASKLVDPRPRLVDSIMFRPALARLASVERLGTRILDAPLYRLQDVSFINSTVSQQFGLTSFVDYALSYDLLEREVIQAIFDDHERAPLRDMYLPSRNMIDDLDARICVGGVLALVAIARSKRHGLHAREDYALLVQRRSAKVLNANATLAVVPKAFHQPLVEASAESSWLSTLYREFDEELFNRVELDPTGSNWIPSLDPMRHDRVSPALRWLWDRAADETHVSTELVGFGYNAVSGNFEAAVLLAIHDDTWWEQFGGSVLLNWETSNIMRYSSLDKIGLLELLCDNAWSNEGLFAMSQGLQRLASIDSVRTDLPTIRMTATQ